MENSDATPSGTAGAASGTTVGELDALLGDLRVVRELVAAAGAFVPADVDGVHAASAQNMAAFVALRSLDLRDLQDRLAAAGLSSLGRCEAHVVSTLDAVIRSLVALVGAEEVPSPEAVAAPVDFHSGTARLHENARRLLGPAPVGRSTRIMVTMPSGSATDRGFASAVVDAGADLVRVNCVHDEPRDWVGMIDGVRVAAAAAGRAVRVLMDLGGPKLRTGPVAERPAVCKLRPERDALGRVVSPARCLLVAAPGAGDADRGEGGAAPAGTIAGSERSGGWLGVPIVPVEGLRMGRLRLGDELRCRDARDAARRLVVVGRDDRAVLVEVAKTTYLVPGTELRSTRGHGTVGAIAPEEGALVIVPGDRLEISGDLTPATQPDAGHPIRIGCTLPVALIAAAIGHRVLLDDGKIGGVVEAVSAGDGSPGTTTITVRVTNAKENGTKLRSGKGINLPDTELPVGALTEKDLADLEVVAEHGDVVALSFVRSPADVMALFAELDRLGADRLGVVLKIETIAAFRNLPQLLGAAMRRPDVGVMIARGDLAVEAGYERLAEVQEEILWLCEAAHLPVIWATQVLDQLARTGQPSRSEISDAAMAERAECVMLNKGPHIVDAVEVLDDILRRMTEHQRKKRPLLRPLRSWGADRTPPVEGAGKAQR